MDFKSLRCILGLTVDTYHLSANFIFLWRIAIESNRQANGPIHPQVEDDIRTSVRILKLFWSVKLVLVVATKTRLWLNCAIVLGFQLLFSQSIRPEEGGGSCQGWNPSFIQLCDWVIRGMSHGIHMLHKKDVNLLKMSYDHHHGLTSSRLKNHVFVWENWKLKTLVLFLYFLLLVLNVSHKLLMCSPGIKS